MTCTHRSVGMRQRLVLGLALIALSLAASLAAQARCWTMVGSDGTVDEMDLQEYAASANTMGIRSDLSNAVVQIRYNIVAVEDVFGGEAKDLRVRLADNGADSRVIVRLEQMNIASGVRTTLATLDSDHFPPSSVAQARSIPFGCFAPEFDFDANVYFVEATLEKRTRAGNPLIRAIQICGNTAC